MQEVDTPNSDRSSLVNAQRDAVYENVLSKIGEAVVVVDQEGQITLSNERAREWLGEKHLVGGRSLYNVLSSQSPGSAKLIEALRERSSFEDEFLNGLLECSYPLKARAEPIRGADQEERNVLILTRAFQEKEVERKIAHRASLERILVDLSHYFVSNEDFDVERLLDRIGEAIEADHVYLITAPPDDSEDAHHAQLLRKAHNLIGRADSSAGGWPVRMDAYEYRDWWRSPDLAEQEISESDEQEPVAYAIPILSARDKLYGYLGIEYSGSAPAWLNDTTRLLDVLGDMLSAYLERQFAEKALRASEERYRLFVTAISEGIWCLEPDEPISTDTDLETQLQELWDRAIVTECNQTMAELLEAESGKELIGRKLSDVLPSSIDDRFLRDFLKHGYVLNSQEYEFRRDGRDHHYVANAVGTHDDGHLTSIWGSWTDVTDRVELERRMVTALEMQQQRIGHELHDGVGQLITGVSMLSQSLAERHLTEGEPSHEQAMKIVRFTREAQQLLKELQRGLAPVQVQGRSLAQSLEGLARNIDDLPGVHCTFNYDHEVDTNADELKLQLYRIAQEAINNALKHADPDHISVSFTATGSAVVLEIADDGSGFDQELVDGDSLGLVSIQYRAKALSADVDISSTPGEGTVVRCWLAKSVFED